MKGNVHMKTITNIIYPAFALFAFACFALASTPKAFGVNPPPDGAYPGLNTAEGQNALFSLDTSTGLANTAVGWFSLKSDVNGNFNTALGAGTLLFTVGDPNTGDGTENTAVGAAALLLNTTGTQNTANGAFALFNNTTDSFNTATGFQALFNNTGDGGHNNVATGYQALFSNTTGRRNVAEGNTALYSNIIGSFNVAVGDQALFSLAPANPTNGNTGGNTAIGWAAMASLTSGGGNTVLGNSALVNTTDGFQNTALGYVAGQNLTTGNNNIYISNPSVDTESNTIRVGNVVGFTDLYGFQHAAHTATFIAGINGTAVVGSNVVVDANGQLGTATSSARFKKNIKPMDIASDAILALKPVTFQYKSDAKGTPQFGLIAEEVAKVNSDLVVRDRNGEIYSVRYEAVNAMLLNEFLKEHQKVQRLEAALAAMDKRLKEQDAKIERVNDKVELSKSAPRTVLNNR
jgi:trimeric autotransporter adhesin